MAKFHGYGTCDDCGVACTPGNFLSNERKRYCISCWVVMNNPNHPELNQIRKKVETAAGEWKCAKWNREDGSLPQGPQPYRN
jgi:hypothetical protein